ncbi:MULTISPECIES: lysozyme inhibitor LprI family protein [unclassified Caulobacter]|uniref:lysozyme inhibitor LprI family protein n=1 Tax=unclassified Caulobacter TaxID=2648921 RepID=UPI00070138E8|nr:MULTISPECIES: lysozyme inhibitor LprI family protein [unclassified Caulobacter]KQV55939.1 hypothetical protein ASC62_18660 [Caulobacter sp. Root342]KQV70887.1 hypothetical protein ASC70_04595 [Caulobacter sp. Root343]
MIRAFVLTTALLAAVPALAATPARRPQPLSPVEQCDAHAKSNMEMLQCVADLLDVEDARLNRVYKAVIRRLPPARQAALRDEQRGWIKGRDEMCGVYDDEAEYGRQGRIEGEICILDHTTDRADALESYPRPQPRRPR